MQKDSPAHNIICNADYSLMMRAYAKYLKPRVLQEPTLTMHMGVCLDGRFHAIGFSRGSFCVCCKRGAATYGTVGKNKIHLENGVYYSRCRDCYNSNTKICPMSYNVDKLCWRGIIPLMMLREYMNLNSIPYELFGYILKIGAALSCREHIFGEST